MTKKFGAVHRNIAKSDKKQRMTPKQHDRTPPIARCARNIARG
jgi:hypothetical protein